MSASDEVREHSKKLLVEVNPPQSWPWKQNGTTAVAAVIILKVKKHVADKYFEKSYFEP